MVKQGTFAMLAGLLLVASMTAVAQTLIDPTQAPRALDVSQFGVPRDAKFIFCNGEDCPERSTKTMATLKPAAPVIAVPLAALPQPQFVQLPVELSRAEVAPAKPSIKPAVRKKKRPAPLGCGPDNTRK
jgi:hypothetical protein